MQSILQAKLKRDCQIKSKRYCSTQMERYAGCWHVVSLACTDYATISTQSQSFTPTQLFLFTPSSKSSSISVANGQPPQTLTVDNTFRVRQRWSRREIAKPLAILSYNKEKSGIDLSDQMASYATSLRKGVKWYRRLAN